MNREAAAALRDLTNRLARDMTALAECYRKRVGDDVAGVPRRAAHLLPEADHAGGDRIRANGDSRLVFRQPDRPMIDEYNRLYDFGAASYGNPARQAEVARRNEDFWERYPESRTPAVARHLGLYNSIHRKMVDLANELRISLPELRGHMKSELNSLFAGKSVAIRMTPESLTAFVDKGRYQPEPTARRLRNEANWFGHPEDLPADQRPVYGYVMIDGERPAGLPETDMLSNYGRVEVVLKSDVRERATACIGDSDYYSGQSFGGQMRTAPSPLTDPEPESFGVTSLSAPDKQDEPLRGINRDYSGESFRQKQFAEAQVHGGVTLADVDHINLPEQPNPELRATLDGAGIAWNVPAPGAGGLAQ